MALAAAIAWEVRTTGSDNNGGGYKTGASGTDRSQQNGAYATLTAASTVHTTTTQINVAVGDFTVSAADVGNVLQITGGSATAGFYEITTADVPNNRWTMDRSVGTSAQTVVGVMGGALISIGKIGAVVVNANTVFVAAGTYTISSITANVSGGTFGTSGVNVFIVGYTSTRSLGNTDVAPILRVQAALSNCVFFTSDGTVTIAYNIVFDGNAQTGSQLATTHVHFIRCGIVNFRTENAGTGPYMGCYATGNSVAVFTGNSFGCEAYSNTATPFKRLVGNVSVFIRCLSYNNTGGTTNGFDSSSASGYVAHCTAYNNGQHGFLLNIVHSAINCHAENNAGVGFSDNAQGGVVLVLCSGYNNTSGFTSSSAVKEIGSIALSGTAFVNAGGSNFALNNTAGGGAGLRAVGFPATFLAGTTANYADIGAAQSQGGGLLTHPGMAGGMRG